MGIQLGRGGSWARLGVSLNRTKDKGPTGSASVERQGGSGDLSSSLDFRKMDPLGASGCKVSLCTQTP